MIAIVSLSAEIDELPLMGGQESVLADSGGVDLTFESSLARSATKG